MKKEYIISAFQYDIQFLKDNFRVVSIAFLNGMYSFLESKLRLKIEIIRKEFPLAKRFFNTLKGDLIYVL
jgi:hypothetical protein